MIDFARLDREKARRGIPSDAELARVAGLSPATLSRSRQGRNQMRQSTFARLARAIVTYPVLRGTDALLSPDPAAPAEESPKSDRRLGPSTRGGDGSSIANPLNPNPSTPSNDSGVSNESASTA